MLLVQVWRPFLQITNIQQLSAAGLDTGAVARRATEAYLLQILRHGFLHAGASIKQRNTFHVLGTIMQSAQCLQVSTCKVPLPACCHAFCIPHICWHTSQTPTQATWQLGPVGNSCSTTLVSTLVHVPAGICCACYCGTAACISRSPGHAVWWMILPSGRAQG